MKKLLYFLVALCSLFMVQSVLVSCEKDDDDYYAGESEADYKPAEYTISATWDLSNVTGITESERKALEAELNKFSSTAVFNSRVEAVAAFDNVVEEFKTNSDYKIPGAKAKFYLKRGSATIKTATITW